MVLGVDTKITTLVGLDVVLGSVGVEMVGLAGVLSSTIKILVLAEDTPCLVEVEVEAEADSVVYLGNLKHMVKVYVRI